MPLVAPIPPISLQSPVIDTLHGISISDPYRWLEDADSPRTQAWIREQSLYARSCLEMIPGRDQIRSAVRRFLELEAYDSLLVSGERYIFRKRLSKEEQPSIYMRDGVHGEDVLLVNPADRGKRGAYTSARPAKLSSDGKLLLFELREGSTREASFELLDVETRKILPDSLPCGYLRGFAFAADNQAFYYVHEALARARHAHTSVYLHVLGSRVDEDVEIFSAGLDPKLRMCLLDSGKRLGFLVYRFHERTFTSFLLKDISSDAPPDVILKDAPFLFSPLMAKEQLFALTDFRAENLRVVKVAAGNPDQPEFVDVIPSGQKRIRQCLVAGEHLAVSYLSGNHSEIDRYDFSGKLLSRFASRPFETARIAAACQKTGNLFFEVESLVEPVRMTFSQPNSPYTRRWTRRTTAALPNAFDYVETDYPSKHGTKIPILLFGRKEILKARCVPVIMTSYGGYGVPVVPQFSVLVAALVARGAVFALPQIRGGSEGGSGWHLAAKRRKRQTAYDDFISAAEWLISTGQTTTSKLAIFGGSNAGLLVGAALTQRPDLFKAALCLVPLMDMLRYHLFDNAHVWVEEFGTSDDPEDFRALKAYSPYHNVTRGTCYPAVLIVSGDADRTCNPLHARKMTARLQAANVSANPILLDYSPLRGHAPGLPLSVRIAALTDRIAFLAQQLDLPLSEDSHVPSDPQGLFRIAGL